MANGTRKPPPQTKVVDFGQDVPPPEVSNLFDKSETPPRTVSAQVHLEAGPNAPKVVPMTKAVLVLGRLEGAADVAVGDESASRYHACVSYRKGTFYLHDMGSTNGTFHNGKIVSQAKLKSGDQIQIGTAVMRFELES